MSESALEIALSSTPYQGNDVLAVLTSALCQHCGRHPFALPQDRAAQPPRARSGASAPVLDGAVEDDEPWLWQLVEDGDRAQERAPSAPTAEEISAARRALAAATAAQRRVETQVNAVEVALSRPSSWLRPGHRMALAGALRRGRAAVIAASTTRAAAARAFSEMDRRGAQRRTYLATHGALLESAADARRELDRRVDDIIDGYARSPEPPAWFRFGLGYPPKSESYGDWLTRARKAVAYRHRHGIDHPLEPTGGQQID